MEELYNMNLQDNTLRTMIEMNPNINNLSSKDVLDKIDILKSINCSDIEIRNIVSSNSLYFDRTNEEIIKLINKLKEYNFDTLNILFDSNPYILNLEPFEIDNYINNRLNNESLEDIIDDLDSNPYLFNEL